SGSRPFAVTPAENWSHKCDLKGHGFTACGKTCFRAALYQGTTSVVPTSRLFLSFRSGFTGCGKARFRAALYQGTTSVVPMSPLFLMFRADFSPRGTCPSDFFSNLVQPCRKWHSRRRALQAAERVGFRVELAFRACLSEAEGPASKSSILVFPSGLQSARRAHFRTLSAASLATEGPRSTPSLKLL